MSNLSKLKSVLEAIKGSGKIEFEALKYLTKHEKELVIDLYNENLIEETLAFLNDLKTDEEWELFKKKMISTRKRSFPVWKPIVKYAAIFIGLCSIVYFFQVKGGPGLDSQILEESITLKTDDDTIRVIRQGESQQIVTASGEVTGEQKGNKIRYDPNAKIDQLVFNELEIPYGKIFDVELSDGTLVHLNSGTKMRYPVKFLKGQKREVFINGEAYFEVAKDKEHPFVVNADAVAVEVLGTVFNVSSYKEDSEIKTVLVEGSVRMTNSFAPEDHVILSPGIKGTWDKTVHSTKTAKVDVDLYVGWVKGELIFRNTSFKAMAEKLERSYNVSIRNNNIALANKMLNARFHIEIESIDDVMKSINEIYPFDYSIKNRKIEIH